MKARIAALLSRKFLLAVLSLLALTLLCAFGKIAGSEFITGLIATLGIVSTANVWQKVAAPEAKP